MPQEAIRFEADPKTAVITVNGPLGLERFLAIVHALVAHTEWTPGCPTLWDFTGVTTLTVSPADIRAVYETASGSEPKLGGGRSAYVVAPGSLKLIARVLVHMTQGLKRERRVFLSRDEAILWLAGRHGDDVPPFDPDAFAPPISPVIAPLADPKGPTALSGARAAV